MNAFDPTSPRYVPMLHEYELRAVAEAAGLCVHIHARARRACVPAVELRTHHPTRRLGVFASCDAAIHFITETTMAKTNPLTPTPIRAPRPGRGAPQHPAPRQGSLPPTIGVPPKSSRVFRVPAR